MSTGADSAPAGSGAGAAAEDLVGSEAVVDVGAVAHGGHCVARHEGRVVFVRHALPGERVRVRITEGRPRDRFLRGDAVEILTPSPHRVTPPCPYAGPGRCGGCDFQHASLPHQRELKTAVVREQLSRLAGLDVDVAVEPVPGDVHGLRWRTRVELAVTPEGRPGLRVHRSHEIVPVDDCLIASPRVVESGVLETVWTGCTAVDVVAATEPDDAVVVPVPEHRVPHVVEHVEVGGWSEDYRLSARGFWQVHPGAAATYVGQVLAELAPMPGERALDLYAGVGLFALALADAVGPQGAVLAVEADRRAVEDGTRNAQDRAQVEYRGGRVDAVLRSLRRQGIGADLVVLDPPRTGAGRSVVADLAALRPRAVAYVACDPAALARDTAYLGVAGYRLRSLRAFDAFPMTHHVECVAVFEPA